MFLEEYYLKDIDLINNLKENIKNNISKHTSYKTNVKGKMTDWNFFIKSDVFKPIEEILYKYKIYQAWGNILKKGEYVEEHDHLGIENINTIIDISGVLYLTDIKPGTYFKEFNKTIDPEIGKIIIFDNKYRHSVDKCDTNKERITLAFNGRKKESYEF
jgi:hypothetical protein